jgi:hypothetical protein
MTRHGYPAGRMAHARRGEQPCDPCREAENSSRRRDGHGSWLGLARHARDQTPVCDLCLYLACKTEHDRARRYIDRLWEAA